jgi:Flp pilus assembly protein TadD
MRRLLLCLALPCLAQEGSEALLKGEPKAVMVACAERARSMNPKDSRFLAEAGRAFLVAGDRERAEATFKAAVASDPKDGETYRLIAYVWLHADQKDKAKPVMERAAPLEPKEWKDRYAFGREALRLGQRELAVRWFERALQARPKEERVWMAIALAHAELEGGGTQTRP